jgi:hypothetical protein
VRFLDLVLASRKELPDGICQWLRSHKNRGMVQPIEGPAMAPPAFMSLIAPASTGPTNCTLEVEAPQGGTLRLEWRAVSATELAELIRSFVRH